MLEPEIRNAVANPQEKVKAAITSAAEQGPCLVSDLRQTRYQIFGNLRAPVFGGHIEEMRHTSNLRQQDGSQMGPGQDRRIDEPFECRGCECNATCHLSARGQAGSAAPIRRQYQLGLVVEFRLVNAIGIQNQRVPVDDGHLLGSRHRKADLQRVRTSRNHVE